MKRIICAAILCALTTNACAQTSVTKTDAGIMYSQDDPSEWPKELDAVIAAPENHKILLENASVRVLEVTLAPGKIEALHSHQWPSVLYLQEFGDYIDRDAKGNIILNTRTLPRPLKFPPAIWKGPQAPHSVENLSDTKTIRLIRVEIKPK